MYVTFIFICGDIRWGKRLIIAMLNHVALYNTINPRNSIQNGELRGEMQSFNLTNTR